MFHRKWLVCYTECRWLARRGRPVSLRRYLSGGLLFFTENKKGWSENALADAVPSDISFFDQRVYYCTVSSVHQETWRISSLLAHAVLPPLVRVFGHRHNMSASRFFVCLNCPAWRRDARTLAPSVGYTCTCIVLTPYSTLVAAAIRRALFLPRLKVK